MRPNSCGLSVVAGSFRGECSCGKLFAFLKNVAGRGQNEGQRLADIRRANDVRAPDGGAKTPQKSPGQ